VVAVAAVAGCGVAAANSADPTVGTIRSGAGLSDGRIAHDAQLRLGDFPSGWVSSPRPSPLKSNCTGLNGAKAAVRVRGDSPQFTRGSTRSAYSATYLYSDTTKATHWFGELTSRDTRACLGRFLRAGLIANLGSPRVSIGPVHAGGLPVAPVGDQAEASRFIIHVASRELSVDAAADVVFVRVGHATLIFTFGGVGSPFEPALEARLVKTVAERLRADVGPAG
jgi:hypothetical protein